MMVTRRLAQAMKNPRVLLAEAALELGLEASEIQLVDLAELPAVPRIHLIVLSRRRGRRLR